MPSTDLSSVDNSASNLLSRTIRRPTNSIARTAVTGGHCRDAVNRRLANAADRQAGDAEAEVRCENARFSALNNMSDGDCGRDVVPWWVWNVLAGASMSGERLSGGMSVYR